MAKQKYINFIFGAKNSAFIVMQNGKMMIVSICQIPIYSAFALPYFSRWFDSIVQLWFLWKGSYWNWIGCQCVATTNIYYCYGLWNLSKNVRARTLPTFMRIHYMHKRLKWNAQRDNSRQKKHVYKGIIIVIIKLILKAMNAWKLNKQNEKSTVQ